MTKQTYGFTIKNIKAGNFASREELLDIMYQMINHHRANYEYHTFETDSKNRFHVHGTMIARKGLLLNRFRRHYWHIHIDPLKTQEDIDNWNNYIEKQYFQDYEKEKIAENFRKRYCFIEVPK